MTQAELHFKLKEAIGNVLDEYDTKGLIYHASVTIATYEKHDVDKPKVVAFFMDDYVPDPDDDMELDESFNPDRLEKGMDEDEFNFRFGDGKLGDEDETQ